MNTPRQPFSLAATFTDQDQAKRVYTDLESALKRLRFDAHVSRVMVGGKMYVNFLHEGEESSIPAPVMQAVRHHLSKGQLTQLPPEAIANIQARRAQRRAQGIGRYESHEPTVSHYEYPAVRDHETKEILAEYPERGRIVREEPYTVPTPAEGRNQKPEGRSASTTVPGKAVGTPGKGSKPLIERYLTWLRVAQDQARARLHDKSGMTHDQYNFNLLLMTSYHDMYSRMANKASKYRLAASAQAMIEALRPRPLLREEMDIAVMAEIGNHTRELDPDIETPVVQLPSGPIWLELEQPILAVNGAIAGIFFSCADREAEQMLAEERRAGMREVLKASVRQPGQDYEWSMHFISSDGTPTTRYKYQEEARTWSIVPAARPEDEQCPTGECREQPRQGGGFDILPCAFCATVLAYWRSWLVTALLAIQGEFAATEAAEWPRRSEQTTRKVKRPNSPKYDEIKVTHDYYLVSFDASVRKVRPERPALAEPEPEQQKSAPRGSWVAAAQEIDPESVVYVRHDFATTQRRLDPERNPRWKAKRTVDVRAHSKRLPMKVENLQRRITRVVASRYEQKTGEEE
jgi:hypothetical protein